MHGVEKRNTGNVLSELSSVTLCLSGCIFFLWGSGGEFVLTGSSRRFLTSALFEDLSVYHLLSKTLDLLLVNPARWRQVRRC